MQSTTKPSRLTAILQAVFVTVLWSTSWVLIKIGLRGNLPALTFAGLRYALAFLCLIPIVAFNRRERAGLKGMTQGDWLRLSILGFFFYTLTQGLLFLSLAYLPAAMVGLLLNQTNVLIAVAGIFFLKEIPTRLQWAGVALAALGVI